MVTLEPLDSATVGEESADVSEYTKPLSVTVAPPSAVTFPFNVAPIDVTEVAAEEVTVGAVLDTTAPVV